MSSRTTRAILLAVAASSVALAILGPSLVSRIAETGYQRQQALLASQGAARISATLGEL